MVLGSFTSKDLHPSAELAEYLSGLYTANWRSEIWRSSTGTGKTPIRGGEILVHSDLGQNLNLTASVRAALARYQIRNLNEANQIGVVFDREIGRVNGIVKHPASLRDSPEVLVRAWRDDQAILLSSARRALVYAKNIAEFEGLDCIPSALFLFTISKFGIQANGLSDPAVVFENGILYQTTSRYSDFQNAMGELLASDLLVEETPLVELYPDQVSDITNALFNGDVPSSVGNNPQLEQRNPEQLKGTWARESKHLSFDLDLGNDYYVTLEREEFELERIGPILLSRGLLYQRPPAEGFKNASYLYVHESDLEEIHQLVSLNQVETPNYPVDKV